MSPTRRQFFKGAAIAAAPLAIPAIGLATTERAGTTTPTPAPEVSTDHLSLAAPTFTGDWTGAEFNAYGMSIAAQVIRHTRRHAPADEQRYALVSIAAHLLQAALEEPGDLYADLEPKNTVAGTVVHMFLAMSTGMRDMLDFTLPVKAYTEFHEASNAVDAVYQPAFDDVIVDLQDAGEALAGASTMHGLRIGAHLATVLHNMSDERHSIDDFRSRRDAAARSYPD